MQEYWWYVEAFYKRPERKELVQTAGENLSIQVYITILHREKRMSRRLRIRREHWPEVTATPHFVIDIEYEGCHLAYEDIYFDERESVVRNLLELERSRKGEVILDGGYRFRLTLKANATRGLKFAIRAESDPSFPGKLSLEGEFVVDGEHIAGVLGSVIELMKEAGEGELVVEHGVSPGRR